jgi:hypothetical protein
LQGSFLHSRSFSTKESHQRQVLCVPQNVNRFNLHLYQTGSKTLEEEGGATKTALGKVEQLGVYHSEVESSAAEDTRGDVIEDRAMVERISSETPHSFLLVFPPR